MNNQLIIKENWVNHKLPAREDPNRYHVKNSNNLVGSLGNYSFIDDIISKNLRIADIDNQNLFDSLRNKIQSEIIEPISKNNFSENEYATKLRNIIKNEFIENNLDAEDPINRVTILNITGSIIHNFGKHLNEQKDIEIENVEMIERGYEKLEERLESVGARIEKRF